MGRKRKVGYDELIEWMNVRKPNGKRLTQAEIAEQMGVTRAAISKAVQQLSPAVAAQRDAKEYVNELPATLAEAEQTVMRYMLNPAKLAKASSAQLASIYGILFDKRRLTQGQSTSNVAVVLESMDASMKEELLGAIKANTQKMLDEARDVDLSHRY